MGRIVAISGGNLSSTEPLNRYAITLTGKENPNVLFIGTASMDAPEYIKNFTRIYEGFGCQVKALLLESVSYTEEVLDEIFEWSDLIYVGGGDTNHMVRMWERFGIDKRLLRIYQEDLAVLTGISAGAICWFEFGHSDSDSLLEDGQAFTWVEDMLGIYKGGFCPHYNEEGRDSFDKMLVKRFSNAALDEVVLGVALENDTAFVETNGKIHYIKCDDHAAGYMFERKHGKIIKSKIEFENETGKELVLL